MAKKIKSSIEIDGYTTAIGYKTPLGTSMQVLVADGSVKAIGTGVNEVAAGNHTHTFASLTSKPTTLAGYGITDLIGNRNLVLNSPNFLFQNSDSGNSGADVIENDYVKITFVNSGNIYTQLITTSVDRTQGETYTVSFDINSTAVYGLYFYASENISIPSIIPNTSGAWQRFSYTYTQSGITRSGATAFLFGFQQAIAGAVLKYRNLKLEKGSKSTDWTPAPEDQITDWNSTSGYNLLKNKPTTLAGYGITDAYTSWNLKTNGVQRTGMASGSSLDIVAGTNMSATYSAGGVVTLAATDTNTWIANSQAEAGYVAAGGTNYNMVWATDGAGNPGWGSVPATAGATATHTQGTAATTWTFNHNLGQLFPTITVYNASNQVVIPQTITAVTVNQLTIIFSSVLAGTAVAVLGGTGAQGIPGATPTLGVGTVTTGAAGTSVMITEGGTALARTFNFIIPRGDTGAAGIQLTNLSSTMSGLTYTNTTGVFSATAGYAIPTTAKQTQWDTAYTQTLQWNGGATGLVAATGRTSLGGTTIGQSMFTLVNPTAVTFPRFNADNTVSALSAAAFMTAIGAVNYVHPTTAGNLHIPAAGAAGQILRWSAAGTAVWGADTDTIYTHPTGDGNLHVPANSTTNNGKVLTASGTAGVYTWQTPTSGVTDHTLLSNIGTNTHAQIDTHIADSTKHFTQAAISITASQVSDFDTEVGNNTAVALNTAKVTNATHTGEVTGSGALTIASGVISRAKLSAEQKSRIVLSTANIDWSLGKEFTKTLTANWTITETNLPTGTDTDCIVVYVTGAFTITPPAYWKKHGTSAYDGTKVNMYVIDCLNGTSASEDVKYAIIPAV